MKDLCSLFSLWALTLIATMSPAPAAAAEWKLVWADEFSKDGAPNSANWKCEQGFARNEEAQWYQPDNARVENGLLIIEARRERKPNPRFQAGSDDWKKKRQFADYTSASVLTRNKHAWKYGRFEMRGRIDTRAGMWPAFWTLGVARGWPSCGEIDIMEYYRGNLLANVAWGTQTRWRAAWDSTKKPISAFKNPDWSKNFHTWRMDWDEKWIRLYVDDVLLNETNLRKTLNADGSNPFHQPHYILLNLAIGGQNGGDPSQSTFPARFEVDWVRVYQKQD